MTVEINNEIYTITKTGYGNWNISNGVQTIHTTDSRMIDAVNDEEDDRYEIERKRLVNLYE